MSGITPPSIVNYEWVVRDSDPSFLNVSFPFRVKIESIWFTTQQNYGATNGLWGTSEGGIVDIETTERQLSLSVTKSKNTKTQYSSSDNPTEFVYAFQNVGYDDIVDETLKPTMWLGNPDLAAGRIGAFSSASGIVGSQLSLRSTAVAPIEKGYVFNSSWSYDETLWNERAYLTDVAVMNTDEFLQIFPYASGTEGDWTGYADDAVVTISIAYSGLSNETAVSATAKPWTAWWND
jgi:hypothetical protein